MRVLEVVLLSAARPVPLEDLVALIAVDASLGDQTPSAPDRQALRALVRRALERLAEECSGRGVELREVASGFRYQVKATFSHWVSRLNAERPPRYSRALLETLALIAYRQPVTRGEIEDVRGVAVSASIMRTLLERDWIRVLGHREVPGRPELYGTTRAFLDDFNLRRLEDLPPLAEIHDLENMHDDLFDGGEEMAPDVALEPGEERSAPVSGNGGDRASAETGPA